MRHEIQENMRNGYTRTFLAGTILSICISTAPITGMVGTAYQAEESAHLIVMLLSASRIVVERNQSEIIIQTRATKGLLQSDVNARL